jgi:hypothetical protein
MKLVGSGSAVKIGTYRSLDGITYTVLGIAEYAGIIDQMVVYTAGRKLLVSPAIQFAVMLAEKVKINGKLTPKFEFIDPLS